ncbi:MAG: hypothetical protein Q9213_002830 [Squamulea squamosa]
MNMVRFRILVVPILVFLSSLAIAAIPPEDISLFRAVQQPAPRPGTPLNTTSGSIKFNVPNTATTITFANWAKLLYQTDISLCLLEGMSDLATLAIRNKGDGLIRGNKFRKSYGKATVSMESYSPPTFALTTGVLVDTLRGIGLFMSLYGYYEVEFDIYNQQLGHVGIGIVQY